MLVVLAACGNQHPTAPRVVTPPPAPGPPAPDVDWAALARLYDDPLFRDSPRLLTDQQAAQSLNAAVSKLVAGITGRNLDMVKDALLELPRAREAYFISPSYHPGDHPLLITLSLFEMRGRGYIPGWSAQSAEGPSLALENRP